MSRLTARSTEDQYSNQNYHQQTSYFKPKPDSLMDKQFSYGQNRGKQSFENNEGYHYSTQHHDAQYRQYNREINHQPNPAHNGSVNPPVTKVFNSHGNTNNHQHFQRQYNNNHDNNVSHFQTRQQVQQHYQPQNQQLNFHQISSKTHTRGHENNFNFHENISKNKHFHVVDPSSHSIPQILDRNYPLEDAVKKATYDILSETVSKSLKSVELANVLRDRVGKDALSIVKTKYGGLLVMLELFPSVFEVIRIPKNDMVKLLNAPSNELSFLQSDAKFLQEHINPLNNHQTNNTNIQNDDSKCLIMNNIGPDITDSQLWSDFGGGEYLDRISIEFVSGQRTATLWFHSPKDAKEAHRRLSQPSKSNVDIMNRIQINNNNVQKQNVERENVGSHLSFDLSNNNPLNWLLSGDQNIEKIQTSFGMLFDEGAGSNASNSICPPPGFGFPDNSSNEIFQSETHFDLMLNKWSKGVDTMDFKDSSLNGSNNSDDSFPSRRNSKYSDGSGSAEPVTIPSDNPILRRLCDIHFVPGKLWDKDISLDIPFCDMITDILHMIGGSTSTTKLKHHMKKRLGESIRIGPLKALILAYPSYFEIDKSMTVVKSLVPFSQSSY